MRVTLPSGTAAELVEPGGAARRGLALCPDIFGLRPLFEDMAARLSSENGWSVCVVEPFPGREELPVEERIGAPVHHGHLVDDLVAAADLTGCERVAVLGFCLGGMVAFEAAGTARFDRAVSFYGMIRLPPAWAGHGGVEPLEALSRPDACPTLAILAGQDKWAPAPDVEALRAVKSVEVVLYPEADHGFVHDPARPTHRADDAADAWRRVVDFLA